MMRKLADLLVQHKEYLAELDSVAMGRPMYGSYGSIGDAEGARIFVNYWAVRRS
jgi:acyl-CoA reductase-like NAD-dependent aldehyde dehydrogenase